MPAAEVPPARCGKRVSSARPSLMSTSESPCMTATVTGRERRYGTKRHRNDESGRSEYLSNQVQKTFFHEDLQTTSL